MNRIFKTVWSAVRRCLVVVNEATKTAAQSRLCGSMVSLATASLITIPFTTYAADWYPWNSGYEWIWQGSANSTYDNFYWTYGTGSNVFILSGSAKTSITNATMNVLGDFKMTYSSAYVLLSEANGKSYSKGTLNIGGDAYIENGAKLWGAAAASSSQHPTTDAVLTVKGSVFLSNGGSLSGGGTYSNTHTVSFNINRLIIGNNSEFKTGLSSKGHLSFTGKFNDIIVQNGGTFVAHDGSGGLTSSVVISNELKLNEGSELENQKGLVVGSSRENYVAVGNSVTFDHTTVTENMKLAQEQGTINVAGDGYVFADFTQTGGVFNNNGDVTFNGANITSEGQLINTGTISFNGTSVVNKLIEGDGTINIIGGTFTTDHFESGKVNLQDGVTTLASLNDKAQYNMTGGELHIDTGEIFGSLGVMGDGELNVIGLNATTPETIRTTMTEFFKKYVPGFVKENLDQYATFNGGKIVLKVGSLTETQVADLTTAFKETFAGTRYQEFTFPILRFQAYLQYSRLV